MKPLKPITEEQKFEAALVCYDNLFEHIRHFRNSQWQAVALVVALLAGLYSTIPAGASPVIKTLLTVFTAAVAVGGSLHLYDLQVVLTRQREIRRRLERYFEFHECEVFTRDHMFP